jgi:hypothetical protein
VSFLWGDVMALAVYTAVLIVAATAAFRKRLD